MHLELHFCWTGLGELVSVCIQPFRKHREISLLGLPWSGLHPTLALPPPPSPGEPSFASEHLKGLVRPTSFKNVPCLTLHPTKSYREKERKKPALCASRSRGAPSAHGHLRLCIEQSRGPAVFATVEPSTGVLTLAPDSRRLRSSKRTALISWILRLRIFHGCIVTPGGGPDSSLTVGSLLQTGTIHIFFCGRRG